MTNKPMLSVDRVHCLKIKRKPFLDLESGAKTGEIRDCSDRDFQVGDNVLLMLVDETGNPTPNELRRKITHIQTGYGLPDGLCVLSYEPASQHQGEPVACMIRHRNIITTARIAVDGKDRFSEWSEWQPSTLGYGRTVADLIRNNPVCYEIKMLFEEQPAPVAVVMPERKGANHRDWREWTHEEIGYNKTLDDVARLNGVNP